MNRVVEPELMLDEAQALAYAKADFAKAHESYPRLFAEKFPRRAKTALVLDLGCGPADVTIRFARANPGYVFHGVDGSAAMLRHGRAAIRRHRGMGSRIRLIEGYIPGAKLPARRYDVIVSSSFLHHLHEPQALWRTMLCYARRGTIVFVADLRRPASHAAARALVKKHSGGEPAVLRRDFYNSLLAAFTPEEVSGQLTRAGLTGLSVETMSDRHLLVWGRIKNG
jgi:SAM-dependent methyltransferase